MRIGIALWNIRKKSIVETIDHLAGMGFTAVSFLGSSFEDASEKAVAQAIKRNGLAVTFHLAFFSMRKKRFLKDLKTRLENIKGFIKRNKLEKYVLNICFDPAFDEVGKKQEVIYNAENTIKALKYSLRNIKGVRIGVENWTVNSRIADFEKIRKAISSKRLGMLLDLGHMNIAVKKGLIDRKDLKTYIASLPLPIIELHVHDNKGEEDSHLPLGRGNMDYAEVFKLLKDSKKLSKGCVATLELKPHMKNIVITERQRRKEVIKTRKIAAKALINEE
ncbi:MAG: TIM barrel protein [Candidatus Firestonebacteria bacterium]